MEEVFFQGQKRTGEQENFCRFPAMQYSLPYSAKFEQGMLFIEGLLGVTKRPPDGKLLATKPARYVLALPKEARETIETEAQEHNVPYEYAIKKWLELWLDQYEKTFIELARKILPVDKYPQTTLDIVIGNNLTFSKT